MFLGKPTASETGNPLIQRCLTALVLIPLLLLVLLKGGRGLFAAVILLVSLLGQGEFLKMFQVGGHHRLLQLILGALVTLSFCLAPRTPPIPLFVMVACLFTLFLFYLLSYEHLQNLLGELALNTLGLLYLSFLVGHFIWLRFLPGGEWWVLWLLAVVFAGDTAAYFTGLTLGKRKLYVQVSPGKTWEGTLGGLAANLVVGITLGQWCLTPLTAWSLAWLALGLGLLGLLGDLFESMLKRQAQIKDASNLLPGHGGMLDRLDSLLFTAPALVYARLLVFNLG